MPTPNAPPRIAPTKPPANRGPGFTALRNTFPGLRASACPAASPLRVHPCPAARPSLILFINLPP